MTETQGHIRQKERSYWSVEKVAWIGFENDSRDSNALRTPPPLSPPPPPPPHHLHSLSQQDELLSLVREHSHQVFLVLQPHHFVTREMIRLKYSTDSQGPACVVAFLGTNFSGQRRTPSHSTQHTWPQHQSTTSFAEDLFPFKVSLEQTPWAIWFERSNQPFYSLFLLLLSSWPFHNLVLDECPIFHGFCWVWPRLKTGRVFILPDKVPMAERFGALTNCTFSPSRWGCNYNLTVWVQVKVRKRYIKFAHMLFSYPHPHPFGSPHFTCNHLWGEVRVYVCVYRQSCYNSHFAKFMQKPNT